MEFNQTVFTYVVNEVVSWHAVSRFIIKSNEKGYLLKDIQIKNIEVGLEINNIMRIQAIGAKTSKKIIKKHQSEFLLNSLDDRIMIQK